MKILVNSYRIAWLFGLSLLLISCGGGGSSSAPVPVVSSANAVLNITVTGLPAGINADIVLSGPNGLSQAITESTTLTSMTSGSYTLDANSVTVDNLVFSPLEPSQTISLSNNQTANLTVTYVTTIIAKGVISQFGSIFVNGVEYETGNSVVVIDGNNASESGLRLGMEVAVQGSIFSDGIHGIAHSISYSARLEGPVDAVDLAGNQFTVLGQSILVNGDTNFEDVTFDGLLVGNVVEVNAILDDDGNLLATRVELVSDAVVDGETEFKIRGEVENLDTDLQTFNIGNLLISYAAAEIKDDDEIGLENGVFVKVSSMEAVVDGVLIADVIKIEDEDNDENRGQQISIDGIINQFDSATEFAVNDIPVTTTDETDFNHGTADDLALGVRVKIHGIVNDDGVLVARMVRLDKPGVLKMEGPLEEIELEAQSFTLLNTVFFVDEHTQFKDKSMENIRHFSLSDLVVGDLVEVKAFATDDTEKPIMTKKLTRFDENDDDALSKVEGEVDSITEPDFTVNGVNVTTSDATTFEGNDDDELTNEEFFAILEIGMEVEVKGELADDGSIIATSVEIKGNGEHDDDGGMQKIELEGEIDSFVSITEFSVNEHDITTMPMTVYKKGTAEDLALGVFIEIDGFINGAGIIVARKIEFDDDDDDDG